MPTKRKKNPVAVALALAKLRAQRLTSERRSEIARKAALARWRRIREKGGIH